MSDPGGADEVESPCVKVCVLNADSICVGCGRSSTEIALWPAADSVLRHTIRRAAALRREGLQRLSQSFPDASA